VRAEFHWTRSKALFKTANCLITDDLPPADPPPDANKRPPPTARVVSVKFVVGDDLL
jgi:hypothetical protein